MQILISMFFINVLKKTIFDKKDLGSICCAKLRLKHHPLKSNKKEITIFSLSAIYKMNHFFYRLECNYT